MAYYLGIDLGGSQIKAGVLDSQLKVGVQVATPTNANDGPDAVVTAIINIAHQAISMAGIEQKLIAAIGVASPGLLDLNTGMVLKAPNLCWERMPLAAKLTNALGKPVYLENDANAAALAEWRAGACRQNQITDVAVVTLGTGVGSGIIVNGRVVHGGSFLGGELGHMIVQPTGPLCACGQNGCLETYASAPSIVQRTRERIAMGHSERLRQYLDADSEALTIAAVIDAAAAADPAAREALYEAADYLAIGCINLCRIFDPQIIALGGGVAELAGSAFIDDVYASLRRRYWNLTTPKLRIVPAVLGNRAGFIGAAAVARDSLLREHEAA